MRLHDHITSGNGYKVRLLLTQLGLPFERLEYDIDRAGGFEPLRFVPAGKMVVLGLVTTKSGELESQDLLRRRIDEAARYVPLERLGISPQCGFSSGGGSGQTVTQDDTKRKLELIMEVAREVWK